MSVCVMFDVMARCLTYRIRIELEMFDECEQDTPEWLREVQLAGVH